MNIKGIWNISLDDEYTEVSVDRFMGIYALEVGGADDFIIATEGEWLGGYSRTGRTVYFTILENIYINGRTAYIHLTSKRNPEKNVTVGIVQESMAYGFDFEEREDGDTTPELERISEYTQYIGVKMTDEYKPKVFETTSSLMPIPSLGGHRNPNDNVEILDVPFEVYGGRCRCYVSAISQYYINDVNRDVRVVYDNGIKAGVMSSSERGGQHILRVTNFGKAYLARQVYYIIRLTHIDNSDVYCEVKIEYLPDSAHHLAFDVGGKSVTMDGNGGDLSFNIKNTANYTSLWTTDSTEDWIETVDSAEGVRVSVAQFILYPDDVEVESRSGAVRLLDSDGNEVDRISVTQTPIKSEKDNDDGDEEEEPPVDDEDVWVDRNLATLTPNPPNARVMLQLSASWAIVSYDSRNHGITLSQDASDQRYPFQRKCRLLVKNANDLSEVLAFDIVQNGNSPLTATPV